MTPPVRGRGWSQRLGISGGYPAVESYRYPNCTITATAWIYHRRFEGPLLPADGGQTSASNHDPARWTIQQLQHPLSHWATGPMDGLSEDHEEGDSPWMNGWNKGTETEAAPHGWGGDPQQRTQVRPEARGCECASRPLVWVRNIRNRTSMGTRSPELSATGVDIESAENVATSVNSEQTVDRDMMRSTSDDANQVTWKQ
jgi:hypothetical protein